MQFIENLKFSSFTFKAQLGCLCGFIVLSLQMMQFCLCSYIMFSQINTEKTSPKTDG